MPDPSNRWRLYISVTLAFHHAPQNDVLGQLYTGCRSRDFLSLGVCQLQSSLGEKRCRMTSRATLTAVPRHIQLHNRATASKVVQPSSARPVAINFPPISCKESILPPTPYINLDQNIRSFVHSRRRIAVYICFAVQLSQDGRPAPL